MNVFSACLATNDSQHPQLPPPAERVKARKPIPPPRPAYLATAGSPLTVDQDLYSSIQSAPRTLVESFTLPIRSGRAWKAPAGSIVRISTPEGPQVGMPGHVPLILTIAGRNFAKALSQATSTFGTSVTPASASGPPAPNSCTSPISAPTTVYGLVSRTCAHCAPSSQTLFPGTAETREEADAMTF